MNRKIDCPSHHQLDTKYNKQYGYEHELRTDLDFCDRYPVTVLIDSKERTNENDTPGCYTVKLNRPLKNVYSIELIGGKLPGICYNISSNNNVLAFQETVDQVETGTYYRAIIPPGEYSTSTLTCALVREMNRVGDNCYKATLDNITKKFTISVDETECNFSGTFNLIFNDRCEFHNDSGFMDRRVTTTGCRGQTMQFDVKDERYGCVRPVYLKSSIGHVLGFRPNNLCGAKSYTAHHCYDLSPFDYLALFVNDFDRVQSVNSKHDGSFCIISVDSVTNSFDTCIRNVDNVRYIKYFDPVLKELSQITIKFVDSNGNLYDFDGSNNALIFEIGCSFGQTIPRRPRQIC